MVSEPEIISGELQDTETSLEGLFSLTLLDDNDHTYQYVIGMLAAILGYGKEKAFAIAKMVDSNGEAVVETAEYASVLKHQRLIHSFGPDPNIKHSLGSMSAIIEPVS